MQRNMLAVILTAANLFLLFPFKPWELEESKEHCHCFFFPQKMFIRLIIIAVDVHVRDFLNNSMKAESEYVKQQREGSLCNLVSFISRTVSIIE